MAQHNPAQPNSTSTRPQPDRDPPGSNGASAPCAGRLRCRRTWTTRTRSSRLGRWCGCCPLRPTRRGRRLLLSRIRTTGPATTTWAPYPRAWRPGRASTTPTCGRRFSGVGQHDGREKGAWEESVHGLETGSRATLRCRKVRGALRGATTCLHCLKPLLATLPRCESCDETDLGHHLYLLDWT